MQRSQMLIHASNTNTAEHNPQCRACRSLKLVNRHVERIHSHGKHSTQDCTSLPSILSVLVLVLMLVLLLATSTPLGELVGLSRKMTDCTSLCFNCSI